ncbi:MAG: penicillin-binding protein 2 [Chloroflexi bacterium]|nr:penicillin-binding protein 2 [Chloroflexota bacterium]
MQAAGAAPAAQPWRLAALGLGMAAFATLVAQHLFWYQVADQAKLTAVAAETHEQRQGIASERGALLDSGGHPLAVTVTYQSVRVLGSQIRDPEKTAGRLAQILGLPVDELLRKIREADREWKLVADHVSSAQASQIEAAHLPGVDLRPVRMREYPEGSLAPQILGFVGIDGRGLSGLELTQDEVLAGKPGLLVTERDTEGGEIVVGRKELLPALKGADLVLTLDRYLQRSAERILAQAVRENKGTGGVIGIMDPTTGAILALASQPTFQLSPDLQFDPRQAALYKPSPVTDTYEPGSVLKLITVAAGIEESAVGPDTKYFDSGEARIDGIAIRNWDGRGYGTVTVRQILQFSLNTGAQWVAGQLGPDRFYHYLDKFGFGRLTRVPLNGEAPGSYRTPEDPTWGRLDLATNAYGQSIAATPLQVLSAVATLGNGGVRMRPQLVREIRGPAGIQTIKPEVAERVVSPDTAETMLDLMRSVWDQQSLQTNWIAGYSIAGKSGTADIAGPGGYNLGKTYASFVGLGPLPNPRFAVLVRVDQPETTWGGLAAAPALKAMFQEIFTYERIPPSRS